ncbi:transposase family protein [Streptomyces sp. NPDC051956]|uniref:transposase family protein n=1 Tax=Streptomyces sp. NPDC051956 TaxID=3365677 RepID=UPI0037D14A5A
MCRQSATVCLTKSPTAAQRGVNGVTERLAVLRDPRDRRGRRHSLVSVLLTACCAVLAGARSYLAVGQWARHARLWMHSPASACAPPARWACAARRRAPPSAAS